jgi:Family of unknown function (DUF5397)
MGIQVMQPQLLVGTWRRFGRTGPVYEILAQSGIAASGSQLLRIRVIESGEELDYPLDEILDDPRER